MPNGRAKGVLREMKKRSGIIAAHAERHRELWREHWRETDLKEGAALQIMERIATVLERLPQAIGKLSAKPTDESPGSGR